jgi:hypothetical protein
MASVLSDIFDFSQPQPAPVTPDSTPTPSTMPLVQAHPDSPTNTDQNLSSDEDEDTQTSPAIQNSPNASATFAMNTARNLQLTADGEKSLLRFSQVFFPPHLVTFTTFIGLKLDVKSALVYQQATLIKLYERYMRDGSTLATISQGSGAGEPLVLTSEIKVIPMSFSHQVLTLGHRT